MDRRVCLGQGQSFIIMNRQYSGLTTIRLVVEQEPFLVGSVVKEKIKATSDTPVVVDELTESTDSFLDVTFEI